MPVSPNEYGIPTGDEIRRLRQYYGLTQGDLAERAGLSKNTICRIESGDYRAQASSMHAVIEALQDAECADNTNSQ